MGDEEYKLIVIPTPRTIYGAKEILNGLLDLPFGGGIESLSIEENEGIEHGFILKRD